MVDTHALIRAIELALANAWDEAHRIVQDYDDRNACWIHAVLHRIEGDEGNSRYWYGRAGKPFTTSTDPAAELEQIKAALMNQ